jgi:hypothetical protein
MLAHDGQLLELKSGFYLLFCSVNCVCIGLCLILFALILLVIVIWLLRIEKRLIRTCVSA